MSTISGIYTFLVKKKPEFENGREYFLFVCVSIWLELLFIWDLFLSVIIYLEIWRLSYVFEEVEKLKRKLNKNNHQSYVEITKQIYSFKRSSALGGLIDIPVLLIGLPLLTLSVYKLWALKS